jgi:hypothetical protein
MPRLPSILLGLATTALPGTSVAAPADDFLAALGALCGKAFEGRITINAPAAPDDPFVGQKLVMHVRECAPNVLRVPFHVGEDRSRTWVLTRTASGLRLEHDHRHADGTSDALTMYGGDTVDAGSANRQAFPANAFSKALFEREGRAVSIRNVWTLGIEPDERFVYELSRPGRSFRVEFDLATPVAVPPAPWGAD